MFRVLKFAGALLFVLAMPLAIISTNVRMMVYDSALWQRGYHDHGVGSTTGMTQEQLRTATEQTMQYFRGGPMVSLEVQKEWGRELLYNQKEQTHLSDVRDLIRGVGRVQSASLAVLLIVAAVVLFRRDWRPLARLIIAGGILTIAAFALVGLLAVGNFRQLWLQFHLVSFTNDFWALDPRTDYMIRLHPEGFWFDMVTELISRSLSVAAVLLVISHFSLRLARRAQPATR